MPYGVGNFRETVLGAETNVYRSGLLDSVYGFSVNLKGGPAMGVQEYRGWRQKTIIGVSLRVVAPTGQYDSTKLINWGNNRWGFKPELASHDGGATMPYVNIYDGKVHTLKPPTLLAVPHTFDLMFAQYWRHPEFKSLASDGTPCKGDTRGLLKRCPVIASGLIGKETEREWEQDDDISTLLTLALEVRVG